MSDGAAARVGRAALIACIGLSAFLLFTIELLAGRLVLPVFGGSPAVWTTALCFFSAVVFLGYLYAHLVAGRLSQRAGGVAHLVVVGLTLAAVVAGPRDLAALRSAALPPAVNVLVVLTLVCGAPAFLLATTTPLLSVWFSRRVGDPWWLYAVSNGASLTGLIAYPLLIAPAMPLTTQRDMVLAALLLLAVGLAVVAGVGSREPDAVIPPQGEAQVGVVSPALPARTRQLMWLLAAAVPAGLLSATTTHLATDHTSTPLLWVGPLAVYLASFVVAFSARGRRVLPVADKLVPAAATLMWVPYVARVSWPAFVLVPLLLACFAVLAIAIHGRLALDRPDDAHLTRFYLVLSAGGLLATTFVALLAPTVFSDVYEYPILLVAGLGALALLPAPGSPDAGTRPGVGLRAAGRRLAPYVVVGVLVVVATAPRSGTSAALIGGTLVIGALVVAAGRSPRSLAVATAIALVALVAAFAPGHIVRVRTFFGVTEVRESADGAAVSEIHGTTLHGMQFKAPDLRGRPTAYFVESGPYGDVANDLWRRSPGGASVGVAGLGVGTMAAYERPNDSMTFFEIDRAIIDLARDERYFTYLADAAVPPRIVTGDARLSLAAERAGSFDLLVLDVFSSDAVPAHLLTREAMRTYMRVLRPGGVIAFHLTNRHFDLAGAVAATARSLGLEVRERDYTPGAADAGRLGAQPSRWVVIGRPADVASFDVKGWSKPLAGPVLTDDFSDLMWLLRFR